MAQYWISHALQHGDLGRVLDPLLLLLLHPATTRVAIHYFNQSRDIEKQPITAEQDLIRSDSVTSVKDKNCSENESEVVEEQPRSSAISANTGRPEILSSRTNPDSKPRSDTVKPNAAKTKIIECNTEVGENRKSNGKKCLSY